VNKRCRFARSFRVGILEIQIQLQEGKMTSKLIPAILLLTVAVLFVPNFSTADYSSTHGLTPVKTKSSMSFDDTVDNLKKLVAKNGMMVLGEINQGNIMSMAGLKMKASSLFIGSPVVGKKLFGDDIGATVAAPFRVTVYEDNGGATYITYFKPSELLGSFDGDKISMAAGELDKKLAMLIGKAGK
jgi:uncharacterized protein (DUF302 family)